MKYDLTSNAMAKSVITQLIINFEASRNEKNSRILFSSIRQANASVTLSQNVSDQLDILDHLDRATDSPEILYRLLSNYGLAISSGWELDTTMYDDALKNQMQFHVLQLADQVIQNMDPDVRPLEIDDNYSGPVLK